MIDKQRRADDDASPLPFGEENKAAKQHAAERLAVAECQVNSLEAAAAVDAAGTVEVPPASVMLDRVAMRKRIRMNGCVVVELDLGQSMGLAANEQIRFVEQ